MTVQKVFARSEVKYLVSDKQRELIENEMLRWMRPDEFGRSTVRSLYYDTPDHLLIRRSLAAPVYKEKLRLINYKQADETSPVYAEIKKKLDGIVYKRRCRMTNAAAEAYFSGGWQDVPYKNEQEDNTPPPSYPAKEKPSTPSTTTNSASPSTTTSSEETPTCHSRTASAD